MLPGVIIPYMTLPIKASHVVPLEPHFHVNNNKYIFSSSHSLIIFSLYDPDPLELWLPCKIQDTQLNLNFRKMTNDFSMLHAVFG